MILKQKYVLVLLVLAMSLGMSAPVFADARTATVRVSCTILPMIEIATPSQISNSQASGSLLPAAPATKLAEYQISQKEASVSVNTNFGNQYSTSEMTLQSQNGAMKIYSVTAL